jgi:hypothetical protein
MSVKIKLFEQAYKCCSGGVYLNDGFVFNIKDIKKINPSDFKQIIPLLKSFLSELEDQDSISFLNNFLEYYTHLIENKTFDVCSVFCLVLCEFLYFIFKEDSKYYLEVNEFAENRINNTLAEVVDHKSLYRLQKTCHLLAQMIKEGSYPPSFKLACNILDISFSEVSSQYYNDLGYMLAAEDIFNELFLLVSNTLNWDEDLRLISHKLAFLCKSLQLILDAE